MSIWISKEKLLVFGIGIFLTITLLETALHFYSPTKATVSGNKIRLEKNAIRIIRNEFLPCFDKIILHKVNSIGFRGEDPPANFQHYYKIVTVGGSTTHSFYSAEGTTWTDLLGKRLNASFQDPIWINNAGLDGHSTYGHLVLVEDYLSRLKPDMILFLVGVNAEIICHTLSQIIPLRKNKSNSSSPHKEDVANYEFAELKRMWESLPDDPDLNFQMGRMYEKQRNYKMARKFYETTLHQKPNDEHVLAKIALACAQLNDLKSAIKYYKRLTLIKPDLTSVYYNIACLYARQNKTDPAIQWLAAAIKRGYANWNLIRSDTDLEPIRHSPQYRNLMEKVESNQE